MIRGTYKTVKRKPILKGGTFGVLDKKRVVHCAPPPRYNKQITSVGEGGGTNYHFRGDLDVAIFPKRS